MSGLAIIIPVHNRAAFTRSCLEHLRKQTAAIAQIIVVDDGSTDGTGDMLQREFPEVTVLRGDGNLWWAGATNIGIVKALECGATHIMTLNDDTVPGPHFVAQMMAAALDQPRALIGAFAVDAASGRPAFGGARMNWLTTCAKDLLQSTPTPRSGLVPVTHYPGRGLLIPAEVFQRIGLFDTVHFPHYLSDYDFTHRARRHGHPVFCNYSAPLGTYPNASGDAALRVRKDLPNYFQHLFGMKGGANLRLFFWFAVRNCPKLLLPICLPVGMAYRILGYPLEWFRETCTIHWKRYGLYRRS